MLQTLKTVLTAHRAKAGAALLAAILGISLFGMTNAAEKKSGQNLSDLDQNAVEDIIHQYLLDNPEVLVEALNRYYDDQKAESEQSAQQALQANWDTLVNGPHTYATGPEDAKVTIVEFFDYNCGYCRVATPTLIEIARENPDIRVVFKEYPIRGSDSVEIAHAAIAAMEQGKYLDLHQSLMTANGKMTMERFEEIARTLDLDLDAIRAKMDDASIEEALRGTYGIADQLLIEGTPSFIIADRIIRGWPGPEKFKELVEEARKG